MLPLDKTLPAPLKPIGHSHPINQTYTTVAEIFREMGFELLQARMVNDDNAVFSTLNFQKNHPARDLMDTFYLDSGAIPIPHTSSMQNWLLTHRQPPFAAVIAGRCFRSEKLDPTHEHTFYQLEGMYVNQNVRVSDLIGTLKTAATTISNRYQLDLELKVLTTYFPFVEPGIEILARKPGMDKWLELIPAGMIHPQVIKAGGLDASWNGFAWAIGIDRLTMLIHGITDLRWLHSGDLRFLQQF